MISFDHLFDVQPRVEYFPEFDPKGEHNGVCFDGIKALAYDGIDYRGKKTKIFSHIGYPDHADHKVPAMVLVHGGGGHPEDVWIKKWNDRGYAAIAMDTTGFFPTKPIPHLYEGYAEGLERTLVAPFAQEGYDVAPNNSALKDCDDPIVEQWMYHAVAQVILAHNILRNNPRIDENNIGLTGISWGGVITSIVIGHDLRFKFAIPIYGSGFLSDGLSGICENLFKPKEHVEKWLAEKRFDQVSIPVLWLCWNADPCFSVNSNTTSYLATKNGNENTRLSMLHKMGHSHAEGFAPEESYYFADTIVNGMDVPEISVSYQGNQITYSCSEPVKSVKLYYIKNQLRYELMNKNGNVNTHMTEDWNILELDCCQTQAALPSDVFGKYVEFTLTNGIHLTTPFEE